MKVMSENVFNAIIEYIDSYYLANNCVPTLQEIAESPSNERKRTD